MDNMPSGQAPPGGSTGHVLLVLHKVKAEIIDEVKARCELLQRELGQKIESVALNVVDKVLIGVSSSTAETRSHGSRGGDSEGRKRPPPKPTLPHLKIIADKHRGDALLLQWNILITVLSLTWAQQNVRKWIAEDAYERMASCARLLNGVSGLSVVLFSVTRSDGKSRFQTGMGQAWVFLLRSVIVSMLLEAKKNDFLPAAQESGRIAPDWLLSFGGRKKMTTIVNDVLEKDFGHVGNSAGIQDGVTSRRKRPRTEGDVVVDTLCDDRDVAIREIRGKLLNTMTYGRTDVRTHLFRSFFFLVEKILSYETVEDARDAGYEIVFHSPCSDTETSICAASELPGSVWDIPCALTRRGELCKPGNIRADDETIDATNAKNFNDLQNDFRSLHVTLRYKKEVVRGACDEAEGHAEFEETELFWDEEEVLSLHRVAIGVLMEAFKTKSYSSVLKSSELSLRAIHVLAVGLRGLLRKSMNMELTSVENCALGKVTDKNLGKGEDMVTASLGSKNGISADGKRSKKEDLRASKLRMTWDEYKNAKRKRESERQSMMTERSNRSGTEQSVEEGSDDDDYDWLGIAGGVA